MSVSDRPLFELVDVARDRLRAGVLRIRGAELGAKSRIGPHCSIIRPWRLQAGRRTVLERAVFLKIVSEPGSVRMGDMVFIGYNSELDISNELSIGNKVLIGPGCFLTDHNHKHEFGRFIVDQGCSSAPIRLEDDVWLGARVVVLPGVVMGVGSIAAAGAVVTRSVEPMTIVAGVPAQKVGKRTPQCP